MPTRKNQAWDALLLEHARNYVLGSGGKKRKLPRIMIVELGLRSSPIAWFDKDSRTRKTGLLEIGCLSNRRITVCRVPPGTLLLELVLHVARSAGVKYVLAVGSAGGTQRHLVSGDIVIPSSSFKGDGTSHYYTKQYEHKTVPHSRLTERLENILKSRERSYYKGALYTTSSIFAETDEFIGYLERSHYLGIDCETAALYAVSRHLRIHAASLIVIADVPIRKYMGNGINMPNSTFRSSLVEVKEIYQDLINEIT